MLAVLAATAFLSAVSPPEYTPEQVKEMIALVEGKEFYASLSSSACCDDIYDRYWYRVYLAGVERDKYVVTGECTGGQYINVSSNSTMIQLDVVEELLDMWMNAAIAVYKDYAKEEMLLCNPQCNDDPDSWEPPASWPPPLVNTPPLPEPWWDPMSRKPITWKDLLDPQQPFNPEEWENYNGENCRATFLLTMQIIAANLESCLACIDPNHPQANICYNWTEEDCWDHFMEQVHEAFVRWIDCETAYDENFTHSPPSNPFVPNESIDNPFFPTSLVPCRYYWHLHWPCNGPPYWVDPNQDPEDLIPKYTPGQNPTFDFPREVQPSIINPYTPGNTLYPDYYEHEFVVPGLKWGVCPPVGDRPGPG